jgi:hypothetical protein
MAKEVNLVKFISQPTGNITGDYGSITRNTTVTGNHFRSPVNFEPLIKTELVNDW